MFNLFLNSDVTKRSVLRLYSIIIETNSRTMIKIKNKLFIILWLLFLGFAVQAQDLYVSTSFHEPATDGLRFIYSRDAVHWDSIPGTFLAPKVGKQKVMRDPSIIRTPRWYVPSGMDQQLAGRPWLRLCRESRPNALERTEIHRGDGRSYYRECMGTGTLLG